MFITFEGLDGSGGTTQLGLLAASWEKREPGREIVRTGEPSSGPIGRLIREGLSTGDPPTSVFPYLFAADRKDHLQRVVEPALQRGAVVLCDRYALSSLAYQAAELGLERVRELNRDFRAPDLVIVIDLPIATCLERIAQRGKKREVFEYHEHLLRIQAAYDQAILACRLRGDRIARIDGAGPPEVVAARIREVVWPM